jgi:class 3 adenylate cyclase
MFQRSLKAHMVDPTSARPGYLSQADIPFPLTQPRVDAIDAALLFVDMSGFTPLTERMCLKGMAGVEELSRHLNRFFGPICDRIYEYGGDVLKFAGDALLVMFTDHNRYDALFPAPEVSDSFDSEKLSHVNPRPDPLSKQGELVLRALRCAQRLHAEFNEWKPVPDITLRLHSGILSFKIHIQNFCS